MDKIVFPDGERTIDRFHGKGFIDGDYEIAVPDFSPLLDLDDKKREQEYDRRTHKRFEVKEYAFALIRPASSRSLCLIDRSMGEIACDVFRSKPVKLGRINNISMGGLVFRYIDSQAQSDESLVLDILFAAYGFYLANVPFETITDIEIAEDVPVAAAIMRQLRVQFKKLTPNQKALLDYFVWNFGFEAPNKINNM